MVQGRGGKAFLLLIIAAALLPGSVFAQQTTAAFLKIPVDPRELTVGSGMTALGGDVGAINYNPAGLGQLRDKEITALYAPQLQGMNLDYFAFAAPTELGSFGVSYRTLLSGPLDGRDDAGNASSGFSAQDSAYTVSFGRAFFTDDDRPSGLCRLGANLKYITSRIGSYSASTYAADLGGQFPLKIGSTPLAVGAAVNNIGAPMKFLDVADPLPLTVTAGVAVQPMNLMVLAFGASRSVSERSTNVSVGAEYSPVSMVALRGSYGMTRAENGLGVTQFTVAGGVGLKLTNFRVDYAFVPMGDLGSTQRISLTFHFGSFRRSAPRAQAEVTPEALPRDGGDREWQWRQAWVY